MFQHWQIPSPIVTCSSQTTNTYHFLLNVIVVLRAWEKRRRQAGTRVPDKLMQDTWLDLGSRNANMMNRVMQGRSTKRTDDMSQDDDDDDDDDDILSFPS